MSLLIEELNKDHLKIVATLKEVKNLGILTKEGQAKLLSAKASFLAHLKKEDEQLYPALRKEAEHNNHVKNALTLCTIDMENVSKIVLEFFDKYSKGNIDTEFEGEFENLFEALDKRIKNEEEILYEEYEWMNQ